MPDMPMHVIAGALLCLAALSAIAGGLKLPRSYWENKQAREQLRRQRLRERLVEDDLDRLSSESEPQNS
jgi:hypothetical protein